MPYIPHTEDDIKAMLDAIGVSSIEQLFEEIPAPLRAGRLQQVPARLSEMDVTRLVSDRAAQDAGQRCFIGAGAYEHHIPAPVWELTTRGEFYSAYTPYQAEASQGTLQLLYEYQSMMTGLTGLDVSNASLYDGASALAEAILMAVRANRKAASKRILVPRTVNPRYRNVAHTIVKHQGIVLDEIDYDRARGVIDHAAMSANVGEAAALVIPVPNFFGAIEDFDALTDWAHARGMLVIAVVNPTALAALRPPGRWGAKGADIACGDGQPLGIPLSSGGPYFGFLCCKQEHVRQMPGRIIGRTVDTQGKSGYVLTLQAREQHIRRSKATSNICTNQGLMVTAATIYMALVGGTGLAQVAKVSHANTRSLLKAVAGISGVRKSFSAPFFHEAVLEVSQPADAVLARMLERKILGGYALGKDYPELNRHILVCATETKTAQDIEAYAAALKSALA